MRVLGLIPARGGSKGIPKKNIRPLCGKPLLQYTVEAALGAQKLARVILSSEDPEIIKIAKASGMEVPFVRPVELAQDETSTLPVVQHALGFFESRGEKFDAVCLLQPTNPLRRSADIDACIELFEKSKADSVVSMLAVPHEYNPHWVYFKNQDGLMVLSAGEKTPVSRRQDLPPAFHRDGSVYVTRCDVIMKQNSLYGEKILGCLMDPSRSINIDTPEDWERAQRIFENLQA